MKSTVEQVSNLQRKLNIEIPATKVSEAFENAYKEIQREVTIKGFRKGKAPIATVKTMYKDRVADQVARDLVQKYYGEALDHHDLQPISVPAVEYDPLEENRDFAFSAEFEIKPDIPLKKLENLQVLKERFTASDSYVNDILENMRQGRAELSAVFEDRPAQTGDIAVIDFQGFVAGSPLENGSAEGHEIELGSNSFIPGFEEGVAGMRIGVTTDLNLSFPEEYHVAELAGKPVQFKVSLRGLKKKNLPELNDAFAAAISPKYPTLDALKKEIQDDFEARESRRIKEDLKSRVLKALVEANPFDAPLSLVTEQKQILIEDTKKRLQQQKVTDQQVEEYISKWDKDFDKTAAFMVQSSLLVDKIASTKELHATPADLDQKIQQHAQTTGIELEKIKEFYRTGERKSRLFYQISEEKVVDYLIAKADVTEVDKAQIKSDE